MSWLKFRKFSPTLIEFVRHTRLHPPSGALHSVAIHIIRYIHNSTDITQVFIVTKSHHDRNQACGKLMRFDQAKPPVRSMKAKSINGYIHSREDARHICWLTIAASFSFQRRSDRCGTQSGKEIVRECRGCGRNGERRRHDIALVCRDRRARHRLTWGAETKRRH